MPPYPNEVIGNHATGNTQGIAVREIPIPKVGGKEINSEEYPEAREARFRKILSSEQYASLSKLYSDSLK